MNKNCESALAIVGGGRWGRVTLSVVAGMKLPFDRIVIVSNFNSKIIQDLIQQIEPNTQTPISLVSSVDRLLDHFNVKAAIIVNAARQHYSITLRLIENGSHVLIEKPMAISTNEALTLLKEASVRNVCILPGLNYRFCSYIKNFAEKVASIGEQPIGFVLQWSDYSGEVRYNETKTYDKSIDVALDVMPHVWSILSSVFQQPSIEAQGCNIEHGNGSIEFDVSVSGICGKVTLERDAESRCRQLTIIFSGDKKITLDFTTEPGIIEYDGECFSADNNWENESKPLRRQMQYFLDKIINFQINNNDTEACIKSVSLAVEASALLAESRVQAI